MTERTPTPAEKWAKSGRRAGILLHPVSFPGEHGCGELGVEARRFVDFLASAGQTLWQIMPLGPTGYGDSPYQCFSAFAGNPNLVSLARLREQGLLDAGILSDRPQFPLDRVDYGALFGWKNRLLRVAYENWRNRGGANDAAFDVFCRENAWLEDYALFMALKVRYPGCSWHGWPLPVKKRESAALESHRRELADEIQYHRFLQFTFTTQWLELRRYANERGVKIIGDIPIFVASDSADAWSAPENFCFDQDQNPTCVAGVPPDYFSKTGQLWGNPLYRWDAMKKTGYRWWVERFRSTLKYVDIVRIDHFRGFEACWEVPAHESTAQNGKWVKGPGLDFFKAVEQSLGHIEMIAEDLGLITPAVDALRLEAHLPGMRVLQFCFGDDAFNPYQPHNYEPDTVVYTGTHDNDTTQGWFEHLDEKTRESVRRYLGRKDGCIYYEMIRLAYASVAKSAIVPLQDALGLGSDARMNRPGESVGNWGWRYRAEMLTPQVSDMLRGLAETFGRYVPGARI